MKPPWCQEIAGFVSLFPIRVQLQRVIIPATTIAAKIQRDTTKRVRRDRRPVLHQPKPPDRRPLSYRDLRGDNRQCGQVIWVGVEQVGDRDGRVSLYLAESLPLL